MSQKTINIKKEYIMPILRKPSSAGLSDPTLVRQAEADLAQAAVIARGKPTVTSGGELILPSTTVSTTSNSFTTTTSAANNQPADTVTVYNTGGAVYVNAIDQTVKQTFITPGVLSITAGNNITITSSGANGTGNLTITSRDGNAATGDWRFNNNDATVNNAGYPHLYGGPNGGPELTYLEEAGNIASYSQTMYINGEAGLMVSLANGDQQFNFATNGNTYLPGSIVTGGITGNITGANVITANIFKIIGNTILGQVEGGNTVGFFNPNTNTQFLIEMGPSNVWAFNGSTGNLVLPDAGALWNNGGLTTLQAGTDGAQIGSNDGQSYVIANANGTYMQTLADTTNSLWHFSTAGSIGFPNQPTNNRTGTADALMFEKNNNQKVIGTKAGNVSQPTVERLVVAGGDGYDTGEGGDIYLWAGDSGASGGTGGDIKVDAGYGYSASEGGTIKIRGGGSAGGTGGFVEIYAGSGNIGAPVQILSGQGNSQANSGNITLQTPYGGTWTFDHNGNLTAPGSVLSSGFVKTVVTTITLLGSASTAGAGARAFATDANLVAAGNFGVVVGGSGGNTVPVYSDGTNWRIG
jgi:hypothetical protein